MRKLLTFLIALGAVVSPAISQVAFDATSPGATAVTSVTTISNTVTPSGAANTVATACLMLQVVAATTPACNYDPGGANLSMVNLQDANNPSGGTDARAILFGIPLGIPANASKTVTCTWGGTSGARRNIATFKGASQAGGATSFPNANNATGTGTAISLPVISAANHSTMDCATVVPQTISAPTQTQIVLDNTGCCDIASSRNAGSTTTFGWTIAASEPWVDVGTDITIPTVGGTTPMRSLIGVGQ